MTATSTNFYILSYNVWLRSSDNASMVSLIDGYNDATESDQYWINNIPPIRTPQVGESIWWLSSYSEYRTLYTYVKSCSDTQGYTVKQVIDENTIKLNNNNQLVRKLILVPGSKKFTLFSESFPSAFSKPPLIDITWKNPYNEILPAPSDVTITTTASGHSGATFYAQVNDLHDVYDRFEYTAYTFNV